MTTEVTGSINRQVGGLSEQPIKGQPISPCRVCGGNHWNDSCTIYCTAKDRKQLLKYRCYVCLKSGHRALPIVVYTSESARLVMDSKRNENDLTS